jgi:hypothetical protein
MTYEEAEALIREHMDYGGNVKVHALAVALSEARRTVSGQEAEWYEVTTDGEREVVSADHYHRHDWPRSTARPLFAAPIPATEQKDAE